MYRCRCILAFATFCAEIICSCLLYNTVYYKTRTCTRVANSLRFSLGDMQSALTSVLEMARLRHNDPDAPVSRDEMTSMMSCISNLLAPMNQDAMNALLQVGKTRCLE